MAAGLPLLYAKGSKNSDINQWRTWAAGPVVFFEYGKYNGKLQCSSYVAKPTNVGRANFRDPVAQALFESQAAWEKKLKEGYYTDLDDAKTSQLLIPMTAHRFDKQGHKLKFPCTAQYKFNGLRALAVCDANGVRLISRGNEIWYLPHIQQACELVMRPGDMLDGEIYIHGVPLQYINSLVKKYRPESAALQFHLYDMPQWGGASDEWSVRGAKLLEVYQTVIAQHPDLPFRLADSVTMKSMDEVHALERSAIVQGYEGLILRNWGGGYKHNYRSYDVFKLKDFKDEEFFVLDMTSRVYVNPDTRVETTIVDTVICQNNINDATFEVCPRGDVQMKAHYIANKDKYIGSKLVVRYLERSVAGIPQGNPVGTSFRIDEDLSVDGDDNDVFA